MNSVEIEQLSFTYPDGRSALRDVFLTVSPGEKVALVGPNGAGKSTLLLHLNGILKGSGSIRICGEHMNQATIRRIRAQVGIVFQNPDDQLFSPTVFDDVAFGPIYQGLPENEVRHCVTNALVNVGMQDYTHRVSHHLSTGEKKRIAIATVLAMKPEILAFDEPTAGLDPRARKNLVLLLNKLPQTMIVATHDLTMVQELFPRTVVMDQGKVVEDGPSEQVLHDLVMLEAHGLV